MSNMRFFHPKTQRRRHPPADFSAVRCRLLSYLILNFCLPSDYQESSSFRFLLIAVSTRKIPDIIIVSVDLTELCPVFGSPANGISPSSMSVVSTGDPGSCANGTSSGIMVTPGPPSDGVTRPGVEPPPPPEEPPEDVFT